MVVAAGVTVLAVAVVTVPTLLFTAPVPLAKTAVRVVLAPAVRVDWAALKLLMAGAATTVTVVAAVLLVSSEEVAVMV